MPEMALSPEDGLVMPKPAIGVGTPLAGDYTWPVIFSAMAAIVMLVLSALKGVRAFSFALTYTNLWYIFGKTGRVRVRVHSFTSTVGSNCFVTTRGEFSAELVKEGEKELDLSFDESSSCCVKSPATPKAGCVVGTEMVFIYGHKASVFTTGSLAAARYPQCGCGPEIATKSASARGVGERQSSIRKPAMAATREVEEWRLGVQRLPGAGAGDGKDREMVAVPEWAFPLLEPLEIGGGISRAAARRGAPSSSSTKDDFLWDTVLNMRLSAARNCCSPPSSAGDTSFRPSLVVRGAAHTATLRKNVVRIWENPSRRAVTALASSRGDCLSRLDADWERGLASLGSSTGVLSLWDLQMAQCVSEIGAHEGPVKSLQFNSAVKSDRESWLMSAGPSGDEFGSSVCLWDSRALAHEAVSSSRSSSLHDFRARGLEVVTMDRSCGLAMHDVRMLNSSSSLYTLSALEIRALQPVIAPAGDSQSLDDLWWNAAVCVNDDEDFWEDGWVNVERDEATTPSVLSRCFRALSCAISG